MAKTYEQKTKAYKAICLNHARLCAAEAKYEIASERPVAAGRLAKHAATWAFNAHPELREEEAGGYKGSEEYRQERAKYLASLPEGCNGRKDCSCKTCVARWWKRQAR